MVPGPFYKAALTAPQAALVTAPLVALPAILGGAAMGRANAQNDARRQNMVAFGGGLASGVALPRILGRGQDYLGRLMGTVPPAQGGQYAR